MQPAHAPKYKNIVADLNEIDSQFDLEGGSVFKLNRYKNEAKKIIQNNPESAYIILGIIACIENDITMMHKYHKNAIICSGESTHSLYQYSCSLATQGFYNEAYEYSLKAYDKTKEDRLILIQLLCISYNLGLDEKYLFYKKSLQKLGFEFKDPNEFLEDDDDFITETITAVDKVLDANPQMIVEQVPSLEAFVDELVEGVDIS